VFIRQSAPDNEEDAEREEKEFTSCHFTSLLYFTSLHCASYYQHDKYSCSEELLDGACLVQCNIGNQTLLYLERLFRPPSPTSKLVTDAQGP